MGLERTWLGLAAASFLARSGFVACGGDNPASANGLTLQCSATPTAGPAPLAVAFSASVGGARGNTRSP